jgi:hypothetical protein
MEYGLAGYVCCFCDLKHCIPVSVPFCTLQGLSLIVAALGVPVWYRCSDVTDNRQPLNPLQSNFDLGLLDASIVYPQLGSSYTEGLCDQNGFIRSTMGDEPCTAGKAMRGLAIAACILAGFSSLCAFAIAGEKFISAKWWGMAMGLAVVGGSLAMAGGIA